ncbi:hypothetical protein NXC24_PB00171 (plasmid) [Rhizobium sp. NXC24]|nr:hypothetical protein NXC24_PB00171 [Rhizobium sp. NXC24]
MTNRESGLSLFIQPSTSRTLMLTGKYVSSIAFSVKRQWLDVRASANSRLLIHMANQIGSVETASKWHLDFPKHRKIKYLVQKLPGCDLK